MVGDIKQESHAIARKPRDAAVVRCGLKFTDIHYTQNFIHHEMVGHKKRYEKYNSKKNLTNTSYNVSNRDRFQRERLGTAFPKLF